MSSATAARERRHAVARRFVLVGWPLLAVMDLLILIARRPEAVFAAEFTWEEANAFYIPTFFLDPVSLLTETWGGTFQVVPRIGYQLLRLVPVQWAPLFENLLAFAVLMAVSVFIASDRLAGMIPDRRLRIAIGLMLPLLAAQGEVIGTLVNAQWYGGLWLAGLTIAHAPVTGPGRWLERLAAALIALTGPFSTLLAPVYLWRLRGNRDAHALWLAAIVTSGGIIQLASVLASGRAESAGQGSFVLASITFLLHAAVVPVLGERLTAAIGQAGVPAWIVALGGILMVAAVGRTVWRNLPGRALPMAYAALVVAASGIAVHGGFAIWPPGAYERYFLLASMLVAGAVIAGLVRRQLLALPLALLLGSGVAADFRLTPHPPQGWDAAHGCIGREEPCIVPIWPPGYEVHWPGSEGTYVMPDHDDP